MPRWKPLRSPETAGADGDSTEMLDSVPGPFLRVRLRERPARPASPETVYRAGSVSKLFTATAAMQLAERGNWA